ncbi:MAG: PAS domain-containing protein [Patescibacteria group bacterium]|nr:PAS domain-containing protein [Patescibacteria group bacterium]
MKLFTKFIVIIVTTNLIVLSFVGFLFIFFEAKAYAVETFFSILGIMIIATLVVLGLIYYKLIKPIKALTIFSRQVALGIDNKKVVIKGNDEMAQMANSLNKMTENLAASGRHIHDIIVAMPIGLVVTDDEGIIKSVNQPFLKIINIDPKKNFKKKSIFDFFDFKNEEENRSFKIMLDGKKISEYRIYAIKNDGSKVSVNVSSNALFDDNGLVDSIIFTIKETDAITDYAKERLAQVAPILHQTAMGNFSQTIPLPEGEDEFTEHFVSINLMIEDLNSLMKQLKSKQLEQQKQNDELEKTSKELEEAKSNLEEKVVDRTKELELAKKDLELKVGERTKELKRLNANLEKEVAKRTAELQDKVSELERFNKFAVGRELKMVELKNMIIKLNQELSNALKRVRDNQ